MDGTESSKDILPQAHVVYTTKATWQEGNDHTLLLSCSDPRYQVGVTELMHAHFGIQRFDSVTIPGGPAATRFGSPLFFAVRNAVQILHEAHHFERIVAVAHRDCRHYRLKYPKLDESARHGRQVSDLLAFREEQRRLTPGAAVEILYAEPAGDHVQFLQYG